MQVFLYNLLQIFILAIAYFALFGIYNLILLKRELKDLLKKYDSFNDKVEQKTTNNLKE